MAENSALVSLVFGQFTKAGFGWRVEWTERGAAKTKDFIQSDSKIGQALDNAKAFKAEVIERLNSVNAA